MFQIKTKAIYNFFLGFLGSLGILSLLVSVPAFAQLDTVDLSGQSVINTDNIDGSEQGIAQIILNVAGFIIFIVGAVAVLFLIWGAIQYLTAGGDDARAGNGKKTIINAIIGLVLAILSFTIVNIVQTILTNGSISNVLGG